MKSCRDCPASEIDRRIDGYCHICDAELCRSCERDHDLRHEDSDEDFEDDDE